MKHLFDVRTLLLALILTIVGASYTIANVVVIPLEGDTAKARMYYLTDNTKTANAAKTACDTGYHMASMFELLDVSNLRYDHLRGYVPSNSDQGEGPPAGAEGWIRTGVSASISSVPGQGNCAAWTGTDGGYYGTYAYLESSWNSTPTTTETNPWGAKTITCDAIRRVWCIQNY